MERRKFIRICFDGSSGTIKMSNREHYQIEANEYFNKPFNIDDFIEKLRSYDDKWAWVICVGNFTRYVDSRSFWEFMFLGEEPSDNHKQNTKIDIIKEFMIKIMNQDNINLLQFVITGLAPIRYYVREEYKQMQLDFNKIVNKNCFTNIHLYTRVN